MLKMKSLKISWKNGLKIKLYKLKKSLWVLYYWTYGYGLSIYIWRQTVYKELRDFCKVHPTEYLTKFCHIKIFLAFVHGIGMYNPFTHGSYVYKPFFDQLG